MRDLLAEVAAVASQFFFRAIFFSWLDFAFGVPFSFPLQFLVRLLSDSTDCSVFLVYKKRK